MCTLRITFLLAASLAIQLHSCLAEDSKREVVPTKEKQPPAGYIQASYGSALFKMAEAIVWELRERKVLVVWLFDESPTMLDDQGEIRHYLPRFVAHIESDLDSRPKGTVKKSSADISPVLMSVESFGATVHTPMSQPTANLREVLDAIAKIPVSRTGTENVFKAIKESIDRHSTFAKKSQRKLMFIIVTDESGNDGAMAEEVLSKAQQSNATVSFFGREAVFGLRYARERWRDPESRLLFWISINRGPETAFPETLQFDGLGIRLDSMPSGFGPYEQMRLASRTGGAFFGLPAEEEQLGASRFRVEALTQYHPELISVREYIQLREKSAFRTVAWNAITKLDPSADKQLQIRRASYSLSHTDFQTEAESDTRNAVRAIGVLAEVTTALDDARSLRTGEETLRWKANYDLILAQCLAYRIRLTQLVLSLDDHAHTLPKPKNVESNIWYMYNATEMRIPDEAQFQSTVKKLGISKASRLQFLRDSEELHKRAVFHLTAITKEHPGTPWARRAEYELRLGFGFELKESVLDPRYATVREGPNLPEF